MLEDIFLAADEAGINARLDRSRRELGLSLTAGTGPEKTKAALYPLLGALENNFLVTVGGAPACLAPDAFEHFTWPLGARGPFRRIKACASCALLIEMILSICKKSLLNKLRANTISYHYPRLKIC